MRLDRCLSFTLLLAVTAAISTPQAKAQFGREPAVRLTRHIVPALQDATGLPKRQSAASEPLTVTITLNWSDPAGFDAFGKEFDDPASPNYHRLISPADLTARFGPTQETYDRVLAYFQQQGFTLVRGFANRLTLSVRGVRSQAERVFDVSIDDYRLGEHEFRANSTDPAVPQSIAPYIRSISGLSNLAVPHPHAAPAPGTPASYASAYNIGGLPPGINGAGQTIGLIEFDNFVIGDVSNWLANAKLPANLINQISTFPINGGTPPSGCNPANAGCGESEVLLDIDAVLGMAPGANVIVFVAPQGTNMIDVINSAISQVGAAQGGLGGIISTSWAQCEREISNSDADSMETLLQGASYSGLTVFASSGDNGSTCANGGGTVYPGRVTYPSDTPHAVSVGGTTIQVGPSNVYQSESWWDSSFDNGNFGTGGYGFSWHFSEPSYQTPLVSLPGRSVPDVSAEAGDGIFVCQAFGGVSPNCNNFVGTSLAAPIWAGIWALASQEASLAYGLNGIPAGGGYLYTIPQAFQTASSMIGSGNDFAHVGLGSPNITNLVAAVTGKAQVTGINPSSGTVNGGTTVTISGHGFIGVTKVLFNGLPGTPAASFQVLSESQIQAVTPACPSNSCSQYGDSINVLTPAGYSQPTQVGFQFLPGVTNVTPNSGTMYGGSMVTVTGSGFVWGQTFNFGGVPAVNVTCSSSTQCTMLSPPEAAGTVAVFAAGSTLSGSGATFTFTGPAIFSIGPNVGAEIGGTSVDIYGTSLSNNMVVKFGNTQVGAPFCLGDTWCTVYSPAGTGWVPVTATIGGITTAANSADFFTYEPLPYGTLSPGNGPDTGGTVVTVTGGNFNPAPGATQFVFSFAFGPDMAPTNVSCSSTSVCTVTTPPCSTANECSANPYGIIKATVNGISTAIAGFSYNLTGPPPPPPPPGRGRCKGQTCM